MKYPLSTFSRLKEPHKTLCRNYEKRLAVIREACAQNRALRRSLMAHERTVERLVTAQNTISHVPNRIED